METCTICLSRIHECFCNVNDTYWFHTIRTAVNELNATCTIDLGRLALLCFLVVFGEPSVVIVIVVVIVVVAMLSFHFLDCLLVTFGWCPGPLPTTTLFLPCILSGFLHCFLSRILWEDEHDMCSAELRVKRAATKFKGSKI